MSINTDIKEDDYNRLLATSRKAMSSFFQDAYSCSTIDDKLGDYFSTRIDRKGVFHPKTQ
jgi:hypothetical protein